MEVNHAAAEQLVEKKSFQVPVVLVVKVMFLGGWWMVEEVNFQVFWMMVEEVKFRVVVATVEVESLKGGQAQEGEGVGYLVDLMMVV